MSSDDAAQAPQALVDAYEAGAPAIRTAIGGLSREQLFDHPVPGTWSIQQIVIHMADCELVFADRMKWIIAEDNPALPGFEENKWMESLAVNERSAADAALLIELTRRQNVRILRQLPLAAFDRTCQHSQRGPMSLSLILVYTNRHLEHHLAFLHSKRDLVRKGRA